MLVGASLVSFRQSNQHNQLLQAAEDIRQAIYETRSLALAPAIDKASGSPGYRLRLRDDRVWELIEMAPVTLEESERVVRFGRLPDVTQFVEPLEFTDLDFLITDAGRISVAGETDGELDLALEHLRSGEQIHIQTTLLTGQVRIIE